VQLDEPGQKDTPEAPAAAAERLKEMGPMTTPQKVMAATLAGAVVLWMFGDIFGISAVVAAMMGLSVLLLSGVLEWQVRTLRAHACALAPARWQASCAMHSRHAHRPLTCTPHTRG
jgi:di/tricarboxylate transporter